MPAKSGRLTLSIVAISVVLSGLSYLLPPAAGSISPVAGRWRMVLTMVMVTLIGGASILFLRGVRIFKPGLRSAYRWLAGGIILFGISLLQWPVIVLSGKYGEFWATSGAVIVPFIFATALMYAGMRRFARLLGVESVWLNFILSMGTVIAAAVLSWVLAYLFAANNVPGIENETYTATVAWSTGYGLLAWILAARISRTIGAEYKRSMFWLSLALGALSLSGTHEYITSYFLTENDWYVYWGASLWPFIITGMVFMQAGYEFDSGHARPAKAAKAANKDQDYINSITKVADLASRPKDVDTILDGLRKVTSEYSVGTALSKSQVDQLAGVYLDLERFLTSSDPLRNFSKEQLRYRIDPGFRQIVELKSS